MRAMVIDRFGGPEVFRLAEVETPKPEAGEVQMRVAYASINPADWKCREGWLEIFFKLKFPHIVGFDAAGVVSAVGDGVTDYKVGDRVVTNSNQGSGQWGSYAEYLKVSTARVSPLPANVDFEAAATIPTAAITSWTALHGVVNVTPGQKILIHGGAGSCGTFAIQFAKNAGCQVITTCSPKNVDYLKDFGADKVINYQAEDILKSVRAWAPDGVDMILDTVSQGTLKEGAEMVKPGGFLAYIGTASKGEPPYNEEYAAKNNIRIQMVMSDRNRQGEYLRRIVDEMAKGRVRPPAYEVLPLEKAGEGQERVKAGHVRGKILLKVADL